MRPDCRSWRQNELARSLNNVLFSRQSFSLQNRRKNEAMLLTREVADLDGKNRAIVFH
jgi:hypothetical protein